MNYLLKKNVSGQALLLVLLGVGAILITVLSVVARSVTDISLTTKDEEAKRAFSAAEAGIENLLLTGQAVPLSPDIGNKSKYSSGFGTVTASNIYEFDSITSDKSAVFWLVSHDNQGDLSITPTSYFGNLIDICWGNSATSPSTDLTPAIELSIYYDYLSTDPTTRHVFGSNPDYKYLKVARWAYDPYSTRGNNFTSASIGDCPISAAYAFRTGYIDLNTVIPPACTNINAQGCMIMGEIKMLYNSTSHKVGVIVPVGYSLPLQGIVVESTGFSGEATRKIQVIKNYDTPLNIFTYGVFSQGTVSK